MLSIHRVIVAGSVPARLLSFVAILLLLWSNSSRGFAGEAVVLAESTELRTADKTLGKLRRGAMIDVSQTSGSFRLVKIPQSESYTIDKNSIPIEVRYREIDNTAEFVQGWVRSTDIHEFGNATGVDDARRAFQRARGSAEQRDWEAACRDYVIAYRLFQRSKGELDDETVVAGKALGWALIDHLEPKLKSINVQDGFSLLVNLYARLGADPVDGKKKAAEEILASIKAGVIKGRLNLDSVLHHRIQPNDGWIGNADVRVRIPTGETQLLKSGTPIIFLDRQFQYSSVRVAINGDADTTAVPVSREVVGGDQYSTSDGEAIPRSAPDGAIFIRLGDEDAVYSVPIASVIRRQLPRELIRLELLPQALRQERMEFWHGRIQPQLRISLSDDEDELLRHAIITLVEDLTGSRRHVFVAEELFFQPSGGIVDPRDVDLDAILEGIQMYELLLHPLDGRLARQYSRAGKSLLNFDLEEAERLLRRAVAMQKWITEIEAAAPRKHEYGKSLFELGEVEMTLGNLADARSNIIEGLKLMLANPSRALEPESIRDYRLDSIIQPVVNRLYALGDNRTAQGLENEMNSYSLPASEAREFYKLPDEFSPDGAMSALRVWHRRHRSSAEFTEAQFRSAIPPLGSLEQDFPSVVEWAIVLYESGDSRRARQYFASLPWGDLQIVMSRDREKANSIFSGSDLESVASGSAIIGFMRAALELYEAEVAISRTLSFANEMTGRDATAQLGAMLESQQFASTMQQLASFSNNQDKSSIHIQACRLAFARRLLSIGRTDQAQVQFDRIEESLRQEDAERGKRDLEYWKNQASIGELSVAVGRQEEGFRRIDRANQELHQFMTRSLVHLSLQEQLSFLAETHHPQLSRSLAAALKGKTDVSSNVCEWLVNGKARSVETLATQSRYLVDPEGQSETTVKLRAAQWKLASLYSQPETPQVAAQIGVLNERLAVLSREIGAAVKPVDSHWISHEELLAAVPDAAAYVDFFHVTDGVESPVYVALVTRRGKLTLVDLGSAVAIENLIRETRQLIIQGPDDVQSIGAGKATAQIKEKLARLEAATLGRLQQSLKGAGKLILCPDGALWLAPWAALTSASDGKYLIQRYELQFVTSGRSLLTSQEQPPEASVGAAVVIADPNYDSAKDATGESDTPAEELLTEAAFALRGSTAGRQLPPTVIKLPHTRSEANGIIPAIERLTGRAPKVFFGNDALEAACRDAQRPAVLHIATHGFFVSAPESSDKGTQHPLLQSGLLFAGFNHRHTTDVIDRNDSILTALELLGSDFRGTDLVVLSACDTGVGDAQTGEGVLGLRQVFEISGARSIVSTLWSIDDLESARLMKSFYEHLTAGTSKAAALRAAQLERIAVREERFGAAHPMYWAAFTVTGQLETTTP